MFRTFRNSTKNLAPSGRHWYPLVGGTYISKNNKKSNKTSK